MNDTQKMLSDFGIVSPSLKTREMFAKGAEEERKRKNEGTTKDGRSCQVLGDMIVRAEKG